MRQIKPVNENDLDFEVFLANGSISAGDVVVRDFTDTKKVKTTTTANATGVVGVALESASDGDQVRVVTRGVTSVTVNAATVNVAVGDQLATTTTAGRAQKATAAPGNVVGYALEAATTDGASISVFVEPK